MLSYNFGNYSLYRGATMKIEQRYFPVDKAKFVSRYIKNRVTGMIPVTITCFSLRTGALFSVENDIVNELEALEIMYDTYPIYDDDEYVGYVDTFGFHWKERV
jgi:hypothetical protein